MADSKYSSCEEVEVRDIDENLSRKDIPISSGNWTLCVYTSLSENRSRLLTAIRSSYGNDEHTKYDIHYAVQILNQNDSSKSTEGHQQKGITSSRKWLCGDTISMDTVLNETSGFLKDGVLKVKVLMHVESIHFHGKAPAFNMFHPHFDCIEKGHTLQLKSSRDSEKDIYAHHQAVTFHSKFLFDMYEGSKGNFCLLVPSSLNLHNLMVCLQMMHGVFIYEMVTVSRLQTASGFEMRNVLKMLERRLIEVEGSRRELKDLITVAVKYRMERLLMILLGEKKTMSDFKPILQTIDVYKMSSNSMKIMIARFLSYD